MKKALRITAFVILMAAGAVWVAAGANRGWTKTSVPIKKVDEVTGIEAVDYEKRFVPGLDFLGAALLGTGTLAGASFLFRSKTSTK